MQKTLWEKIYLASLGLFIFEEVFRRSTYMNYAWGNLFCLVLMAFSCGAVTLKLAVDFFCGRLSPQKLFLMVIPVLGCVFLVLLGKTGVFMFLLLFSAAGHDVPWEKIVRLFSLTLLGTLLFILLSSILGLTENTCVQQMREEKLFNRYGCGFEYYYMASHYSFFAVIVFLYAKKEKISPVSLVLLCLMTLYIYAETGTIFPCYLSLLTIGICVLLKCVLFFRSYHLVYGVTAVLIYPLMASGILLCSVLPWQNSVLWQKIDALTSHRLSLNLQGYIEFGLKLFGNDIRWLTNPENYNLVDSSYLMYLYEYGILFLSVVLLVCVFLGVSCHRKKDSYYAWLTCIIAIYAMFDNWWLRPECNLFMMAYPYAYSVWVEFHENRLG